STSSRDRATDRKSPGRARRERTTAVATSATPAPKEASSGTGSSVFRFGRNVRKAMAHRSWKIRIPRVARPASVPISSLSKSSLTRSEEHTSELQSRFDLVCRLLLEKKKNSISEDLQYLPVMS